MTNVLDLGCGTGRTTSWLHKNGFKVLGIDISEYMIDKAKELHPQINFKLGDATKLENLSETYDYVLFSFNGLDYIYPEKHRLQTLNEIHRIMKNNGLFIFSSHNRLWLSLPTLRRIFRIYCCKGQYHLEKTNYGYLVTYSITPWKQKKQLDEHRFNLLEKFGSLSKSWIYYVARRH